MTLSDQLKALANGINPDTGELLPSHSVVNRPDAIRLLFTLAEELAQIHSQGYPATQLSGHHPANTNTPANTQAQPSFQQNPDDPAIMVSFRDIPYLAAKAADDKPRLTPEQRRQKNLAEGRPAKSHFPWTEAEQDELATSFRQGQSIDQLTQIYERSALAIAAQLAKVSLITPEEFEEYRVQSVQQKQHVPDRDNSD